MEKYVETTGIPKCRTISGDIRALKVEHAWTIRNYSVHHAAEPGVGIVSTTFFVGGSGDLQGRLVLFPHGYSDQDPDHVSLYLYLDSRRSDRIRALLKCYLLDGTRTSLASCRAVNVFARGQGYGFPAFVRRDALARVLVDDTLTVFCAIGVLGAEGGSEAEDLAAGEKFIQAFFSKSASRKVAKTSAKDERTVKEEPGKDGVVMGDGSYKSESNEFSEGLKKLLENEFSDVTLVCRGAEFRAHRNILAARSLVFSAMFMRTSAGCGNRFDIDDVEPNVMREVLRYIYTAKVENWNLSPGLLEAADKFDLTELKTACGNILVNQMNLNNVCDVLRLADKHKIPALKSRALGVIALCAKTVVLTPGFKSLMASKRTDLLAEAFLALATM